jgi:3-deoxy-D-manno-octulosonate 8-phosphate phosphatase (KDO 8-P phosphatase)
MSYKRKKIAPINFLIDLDGVFTDGKFHYSEKGKIFKVFGADDHEAINILKNYMYIHVITADVRGFDISRKRINEDMNLPLDLVGSKERLSWLADRFDLNSTIYMGDGIFDSLIFTKVMYSIAPRHAFIFTKEYADHVTKSNGGERAVAEACLHILTKFFSFKSSDILKIGL